MATKNDFQSQILTENVVITAGTSSSNGLSLGGCSLVGVVTPATMTSTSLRFEASFDGGTSYIPIENGAGGNISKTISGGEYIPLDAADFLGVNYLRIISGSNEASNRTLTVIMRAI